MHKTILFLKDRSGASYLVCDVKAKSESFMATLASDAMALSDYKNRRENFFLKADLNNDGLLNLDEFKSFMANYSDWE